MECVLAPIRDWLGGWGGDYALCPGPPPNGRGAPPAATRRGMYAGGGRRAERRGLGPLAGECDSGCGGARRCAGCATAWDADYARCPICGAAGACDGDGDGGGGGRYGSGAPRF